MKRSGARSLVGKLVTANASTLTFEWFVFGDPIPKRTCEGADLAVRGASGDRSGPVRSGAGAGGRGVGLLDFLILSERFSVHTHVHTLEDSKTRSASAESRLHLTLHIRTLNMN